MEQAEILPDSLQDARWPVTLYVDADEQNYYFGYMQDGQKHLIGSGMAKLLSTEVNWGFTGVFVGMYTVGTEALYRWFRYEGEG